jgi:KTSC domain
MQLEPVSSSAISHVGYDPETREMRVRFHGGRTYSYPNVPAETHAGFIAADSVGKHFSANIRKVHAGTIIDQ